MAWGLNGGGGRDERTLRISIHLESRSFIAHVQYKPNPNDPNALNVLVKRYIKQILERLFIQNVSLGISMVYYCLPEFAMYLSNRLGVVLPIEQYCQYSIQIGQLLFGKLFTTLRN